LRLVAALWLVACGCQTVVALPEPDLSAYPIPKDVLTVACEAVRKQPAQYPQVALQPRARGWVVAALTVDGDGMVTAVDVLDSSPEWLFDRSAKAALRKWRYCESTADVRVTHVMLRFVHPNDQ
jgi:TonB family protein